MNGWRKKIDFCDQKLNNNFFLVERHYPQSILFVF